ncbi:hypothetical protein CVT24_003237 [Panaeolus cyanescens]|uniref:Peptidase M43 pregnancy-associated plasma-A domain-containing protein n=1 Tax=Panaeolus cyanescens TaxID=181874 RepID=A0A409X231_9AGAR|nr:hypothetical protein CVT24_003237 [Panaeolus cyanescens]
MLLLPLLSLTTLLSISVSATPGALSERITGGDKPRTGFCASPYSTHENAIMKEAITTVRAERQKAGIKKRQIGGSGGLTRTFDVNFNIVAGNMTLRGGWVPDSMIEAQMAMLNADYAPSGIQFRHRSTTRILSNYLAHELFLPDTLAREDLILNYGALFKQGDMRTLNVNTLFLTALPASSTAPLPDGSLIFGFALPPSISISFPLVDGVYIRHDSMPGGPFDRAQGGTLRHEIGHWLGLWHTFQDGCTGDGDEVDDTPAQRDSSDGCPIGRDSCPGRPGLDPIRECCFIIIIIIIIIILLINICAYRQLHGLL